MWMTGNKHTSCSGKLERFADEGSIRTLNFVVRLLTWALGELMRRSSRSLHDGSYEDAQYVGEV